ncbi:hypothetical protein PsAD13_01408 [Pseudovibrio sp. Ad13]|uniref:phage tail tube protein n=1 Tax=Pseudovibrio sp. Ad13 TaxID=989396 RepID=UPI0007AE4CC5|nr:phage tail tube protein [Pseudovibrio sp. Ad13]KZK84875.1 hypothetical protein PsAD13_01408 [Pseudovibrio sp. Ad13]
MARAQGARSVIAAAFEATYGTAPAAGSYWIIPFASSNLGSEQPLLESELLGQGRDPYPPVKDAITTEGDISVPIDVRYLGIWLKALFGEPETTGSAVPYSHEFQSGKWDLPSLAIEVGMPDVPYFAMNTGCRANSINWTMQRSGLVTATLNLIAQGEVTGTTSSTGDLEQLPLKRFGSFSGSILRNDVQLGNITSGQITYTNNLEPIETIRGDGMIDGADPAMAMLSGTIDVRFADQTLLSQALSGDPCKLSFRYALGSDTSFELVAHAVYLPKPKLAIEGPGGVQVSFAWQAARDETLGRMATATLQNDVASYDNPSV